MRIKVPEYYVSFKCIADKCKDSCCVGWEIDVDEVTREKYKALGTPLGREICEKTSHGCFPLEKTGVARSLTIEDFAALFQSLATGIYATSAASIPGITESRATATRAVSVSGARRRRG